MTTHTHAMYVETPKTNNTDAKISALLLLLFHIRTRVDFIYQCLRDKVTEFINSSM